MIDINTITLTASSKKAKGKFYCYRYFKLFKALPGYKTESV